MPRTWNPSGWPLLLYTLLLQSKLALLGSGQLCGLANEATPIKPVLIYRRLARSKFASIRPLLVGGYRNIFRTLPCISQCASLLCLGACSTRSEQ